MFPKTGTIPPPLPNKHYGLKVCISFLIWIIFAIAKMNQSKEIMNYLNWPIRGLKMTAVPYLIDQ